MASLAVPIAGDGPSTLRSNPKAKSTSMWGKLVSLNPMEHPHVHFTVNENIFGRTSDIEPSMRIQDLAISKKHCIFRREKASTGDEACYLYDVSTNGTFVNGVLIGRGKRLRLKDGDEISMACKGYSDPAFGPKSAAYMVSLSLGDNEELRGTSKKASKNAKSKGKHARNRSVSSTAEQFIIRLKKEPIPALFESLHDCLQTEDSGWMDRFVDLGGLNSLIDVLEFRRKKPRKTPLDYEIMEASLRCLIDVLDTNYGIDKLATDSSLVSKIASSLASHSTAKRAVPQVLAALALYSEVGHMNVLKALEEFSRKERAGAVQKTKSKGGSSFSRHLLGGRFAPIVRMVQHEKDLIFKESLLVLINAIVNSPSDTSTRVILRKEFLSMGFLDILDSLQQNLNTGMSSLSKAAGRKKKKSGGNGFGDVDDMSPDDEDGTTLLTQISIFLSEMRRDEESCAVGLAAGENAVNLGDAVALARAVQDRVESSPSASSFLRILQSLLLVQSDPTTSPKIWKGVEDIVSSLAVHSGADEADSAVKKKKKDRDKGLNALVVKAGVASVLELDQVKTKLQEMESMREAIERPAEPMEKIVEVKVEVPVVDSKEVARLQKEIENLKRDNDELKNIAVASSIPAPAPTAAAGAVGASPTKTIGYISEYEVDLKELEKAWIPFALPDYEKRVFMQELHGYINNHLAFELPDVRKLHAPPKTIKSNKKLFGNAIFHLIDDDGSLKKDPILIPKVVSGLGDYILSIGSKIEGVFRLSPDNSELAKVKNFLNTNKDKNFEVFEYCCKEDVDIHIAATLLKQFINELPQALIPAELTSLLCSVMNTKTKLKKVTTDESISKTEIVLLLLHFMTPSHLLVLIYICLLLDMFAKDSAMSKMSIQNLAIVFAPNIFASTSATNASLKVSKSPSEIIQETQIHTSIATKLIEFASVIGSIPRSFLSPVQIEKNLADSSSFVLPCKRNVEEFRKQPEIVSVPEPDSEGADEEEAGAALGPPPPPPPPPGPPAPPGGAGGPPPPPPPGAPGGLAVGPGCSAKPTVPMRILHWKKLANNVMKKADFFSSCSPESVDINRVEFETLFGQKEIEPKGGAAGTTAGGKPKTPADTKVYLLDLKRSNNIGIFLAKTRLNSTLLKTALLSCDLNFLDSDSIENLRTLSPTQDEESALKGYKGPIEKLGDVEKFMLSLMSIPRIAGRISTFSYQLHFPEEIRNLEGEILAIKRVVKEVDECEGMKMVMETVLAFGNFLNASSFKGNARGFKLDILTKLRDTRSTNGKTNLLNYILSCLQSSPDKEKWKKVLLFIASGVNWKNACSRSTDAVAGAVKLLKDGLGRCADEVNKAPKKDTNDQFREKIGAWVAIGNENITRLQNSLNEVVENYKRVVSKFGEDPNFVKTDEFFTIFATFAQQCDKAIKDIEVEKQKREKEKKLALRKAQEDERKQDHRNDLMMNIAKRRANIYDPVSRAELDERENNDNDNDNDNIDKRGTKRLGNELASSDRQRKRDPRSRSSRGVFTNLCGTLKRGDAYELRRMMDKHPTEAIMKEKEKNVKSGASSSSSTAAAPSPALKTPSKSSSTTSEQKSAASAIANQAARLASPSTRWNELFEIEKQKAPPNVDISDEDDDFGELAETDEVATPPSIMRQPARFPPAVDASSPLKVVESPRTNVAALGAQAVAAAEKRANEHHKEALKQKQFLSSVILNSDEDVEGDDVGEDEDEAPGGAAAFNAFLASMGSDDADEVEFVESSDEEESQTQVGEGKKLSGAAAFNAFLLGDGDGDDDSDDGGSFV